MTKDPTGNATVSRQRFNDPLLLAIIGTACGLAVLVLLIAFVWGSSPVLAELSWFNPMLFIAISLTSFIIALHTLGRCLVLRDAFSYWVGFGFVVSSIALAFYVLAWPGLLPDGRSFIAQLPGTAGFISTLNPTLLVIFILIAVFARWPSGQALTRRLWLWSLSFWVAATALLHILIVGFERNLPVMVRPDGTFTLTLAAWNGINVLLLVAGSVLATRRYLHTGDALSAYVVFPQLAVLFADFVLIIGGKRYDLWWYSARVVMVSGFLVVLLGLMVEYIRLFRREHQGRMMLDAIMDHAPIGLVVTGGPPQFPILRVSKRGLDLNQRPIEELTDLPTGQHQAAWKIFLPDGITVPHPEQIPLYRASHFGEETHNQEFVMKSLDGRAIPVLVNAGPIRDAQGQIAAAISAWLDVTKIKETEAALQQYAADLERSNRDLRNFAVVAAHDLQEPLRKIAILGDAALEGAAHLDARHVDRIQRLRSCALQMREMVDGLHQFALVTSSNQPFQPVDLNEVARRIMIELKPEIQKSGGVVEVDRLPIIEADPVQMQALFLHLVENGLKFQPLRAQPHIKVHASLAGSSQVQIQVEDNGIGFDETHGTHLFEPFERLVGKGENQYKGVGIGLAICRWIVDRHGGEIIAHSQPGLGTTFTIRLPTKQARIQPVGLINEGQ